MQDLITSTRSLSQKSAKSELFSAKDIRLSVNRLNQHLKKMDFDEMRELVFAFKLMILEMQNNRQNIAHISELEGWREVAKRVAHEIKNPLTPIELAVSHVETVLSKNDFELYEKLHPSFNLVHDEVRHISKLVEDFSSFSVKPNLNLQLTNVQDIIQDICRFTKNKKGIITKVHIGKIPKIRIDKDKIYSLLLNLTKNSFEAFAAEKRTPHNNNRHLPNLPNHASGVHRDNLPVEDQVSSLKWRGQKKPSLKKIRFAYTQF